MANSSWLREQQELQRLLDRTRNDVDKMINYERSGERSQVVQYKRDAKAKLKQVDTRFPKLERQLQEATNITDSELRLRALQLKKIKKDYTEFKNLVENRNNERSRLGGQEREMAVMESYGSDGTTDLNNQQLRQRQYEKKQDIDEGLEEVLQGVKRINQIGYDIHGELERQDVILDEIGAKMDVANNKVGTNNQRLDFLNKKAKDKGCCCLMCVLFLVIVFLFIWNLS